MASLLHWCLPELIIHRDVNLPWWERVSVVIHMRLVMEASHYNVVISARMMDLRFDQTELLMEPSQPGTRHTSYRTNADKDLQTCRLEPGLAISPLYPAQVVIVRGELCVGIGVLTQMTSTAWKHSPNCVRHGKKVDDRVVDWIDHRQADWWNYWHHLRRTPRGNLLGCPVGQMSYWGFLVQILWLMRLKLASNCT